MPADIRGEKRALEEEKKARRWCDRASFLDPLAKRFVLPSHALLRVVRPIGRKL